jgi:hypothetical protein
MIGCSPDLKRYGFTVPKNSSKVSIQFILDILPDEFYIAFGMKNNMAIDF